MAKKALPFALAALFAAAIFGLEACKKNDLEGLTVADHESEWAFPLFRTELGIEDLLQSTLKDTAAKLLVGPDGRLTFFYQGDVAEKYATELFLLFDTIPLGTANFKKDTTIALPASNGLKIKRVHLKSGYFVPFVIGAFPTFGNVDVEFTVDQLYKNGQPLVVNFTVPPTSAGLWFSLDTIWLDDQFEISAPNDSISYHYKATDQNGFETGFFTAGLLGREFEFSYVEGKWPPTVYPLHSDIIPIDIYDFVAGDGKIQFEDPRIRAYILNSYGFPTKAKIDTLRMQLKNGDFVDFEGTAIQNGISANYPKLSEVGQTKVTEFYFDKTNSNIADLFNSQPVALQYDFEGISNPDNDPDFVGFITDSSVVRLRVRVELPLKARAKDFVVQDTLPVEFGEFGSVAIEKIRSIELKLVTENAMPVGLETQILFLNENGAAIDSLFTSGEKEFLKPAPVNADGIVQGEAKNEIFIPMSREQFDRVRASKKAVVRARLNTSGGPTQNVVAEKAQKMKIRAGLKVQLF